MTSSTPTPPSTRALEEARQRLDRELAKHPDDVKLLLLRGRADERLEAFEDAALFFQRAAKVLRASGDRSGEAGAVLEAAQAYGRAGEFTRARLLFMRSITTWEELGDDAGAARARAAYARMQLGADAHDEAAQQLELTLAPLEAANEWDTLGWVHEQRIALALERGDAEGALSAAKSAVECAAKGKDRTKFGERLARVAALHQRMGNWGKARSYQERALPYLREAEAWVAVLDGLQMLIDGALHEGDVARAEVLVADGTEVADRVRKPMYQGRMRARSGEILLRRADPTQARTVLETAVDQLQRAGDLRSSAPAYEALGRAHWRLGQRDRALAALDRAEWMLRQLGDEVNADRVAKERARAAAGAWKG